MPSQVGYETADSEHETTGAPSAGGKSTLVVVVSAVSIASLDLTEGKAATSEEIRSNVGREEEG